MKVVNGIAKWVAVFAVGLSAALLVIIFLTPTNQFSPFGLRIVMLIAAGFMAGLTSRLLFRRLHPFLQTLFVMVACMAATLLIDAFYPSSFTLEFFSRDLTFKTPTISDISQIILAGMASLPPVWFFRKHKRQPSAARPMAAVNEPAKKKMAARISFTRTLEKLDPKKWKKPVKPRPNPSVNRKAGGTARSAPVRIAAPKKKTSAAGMARAVTTGNKPAARLSMPRKRTARHDNDVKLKGEEEHRCPYCLDLVQKHDPRGIVVCPECGTWHHKDCWDVTGSCQVAHRNEL